MLTASVPSSAASGSNRTSTAVQSQTQPSAATAAVGVSPYSMKVGANAASSSRNYFQQTMAMQANKAASTSTQGTQQQQPMVIPNSAGFPPRSLHAYIPGLPVSSFSQKSNSSTPSAHRHQVRGCSQDYTQEFFFFFLEWGGTFSTPKACNRGFIDSWVGESSM